MGGVSKEIALLLLNQFFLCDVGDDNDGGNLIGNRIVGYLTDHHGKCHFAVGTGKGVILVQVARDILIYLKILNEEDQISSNITVCAVKHSERALIRKYNFP